MPSRSPEYLPGLIAAYHTLASSQGSSLSSGGRDESQIIPLKDGSDAVLRLYDED